MSDPLELVFRQGPGTPDLVFEPPAGVQYLATITGVFGPLTASVHAAQQYAATVTGTFAPLEVDILAVPPTDAAITGTFAPLEVAIRGQQAHPAHITGAFDPLIAMMDGEYLSNTARPTVGHTGARHQVAGKLQAAGGTVPQQDAAAAPAGWQTFWQKVTGTPQSVQHPLPEVLRPQEVAHHARHQDASPVQRGAGFLHQDATPIHQQRGAAFQQGAPLRGGTGFRHQDGTRTHSHRAARHQDASPLRVTQRSGVVRSATALVNALFGRHQDAMRPPPGISMLLPPTLPPGGCYLPSGNLVFERPWLASTKLVFACDGVEPPPPHETVIVPVRRVYIVLNNVNLRRVSDNAVVPCLSMSLSLDASSWTWGFNATVHACAQALVEPDANGPVELKASVNGTDFRVLAENVSRERVFGQMSIKVSGRGRNAVLDAPYSPQQVFGNTNARTHQQLFDDVLTFNGVPLGYAIDYGLEAWNVPAGVFNHQGTYISALAALAQAGGGYMIPHPSNLSFKVRHRYPTKPWEIAEPDFILPADVLTRESIAWKEKPAYNRVYVAGQDQGVLGRVTRSGTAGDILAPMVTDPLITTAAAARQRGLAVLGDTGKQLELGISLPVLNTTGIIEPGMYVQYVDGATTRTGIVRSTNVTVGDVDVKQTLGIEVHA